MLAGSVADAPCVCAKYTSSSVALRTLTRVRRGAAATMVASPPCALLTPIRRVVPTIGGFDLSPLVLLIAVYVLQLVVTRL